MHELQSPCNWGANSGHFATVIRRLLTEFDPDEHAVQTSGVAGCKVGGMRNSTKKHPWEASALEEESF